MKRIHINMTVSELDKAVAFYSGLFAQEPTVRHSDYAKWMLDDPRVNFAVSTRGAQPGIDHLGIQADSDAEMAEMRTRLTEAEASVYDQGEVTCCYAKSTKTWIRDPDGVAWETFLTHGQVTTYGDGSRQEGARTREEGESACCGSTRADAASAQPCC